MLVKSVIVFQFWNTEVCSAICKELVELAEGFEMRKVNTEFRETS